MYPRVNTDECLICNDSLLKGISFYALITNDLTCYQCRRKLKFKIRKEEFESYPLYTLYSYDTVSSLLIRYKDYLDLVLAPIFLSPIVKMLNTRFKNYEIVLIPSSESMLKRRGFNHLNLMLKDCRLPIVDCLSKADNIQRFSADRHVDFNLEKEHAFDKVIIFDDVMTSGNSMRAAIKLIAPLASKVVLISLVNNMK